MEPRISAPDPLPSESISAFIRRMNRETSLRVMDLHRRGGGGAAGAWSLLAGPAGAFFRSWIFLGGCRRGRGGFVHSVLCAVSELSLRAKLWEYRSADAAEKPPVDEEGIRAMERRYGR